MQDKRLTFKSKPDKPLERYDNLIAQKKPEENEQHKPEEANG
jgi:hypothetical protein